MSYTQSNTHKLTEFIPTYVPHSDYLPNRVVDVRQNEANQWVPFLLYSASQLRIAKKTGKGLQPKAHTIRSQPLCFCPHLRKCGCE